MNNKGYLLVEIIVASVIAMSMMYFLLEITIKLKNINEDYYVETKLETDQILMLKDVMKDLSDNTLLGVSVDDKKVIFNFIDSSNNEFNTKISIEDNIYKYGKVDSAFNYLGDEYTKSFDNNLNVSNTKIENLCYHENEYKDCNGLDSSTVSKGLLKINIPATTIYSDTDYGMKLVIPYSYKNINIITEKPAVKLTCDNLEVNASKPSFSNTATTDEGLFSATDNVGTSCYYRGAVTNNYVYFANYYWRIIRINGDGIIRMIYDGTMAHDNGTVSSDRQLANKSKFNSLNNHNAHVGFMIPTVLYTDLFTDYEDTHANDKNSVIKDVLENWFSSKLSSYSTYISNNVIYCNDRGSYTGKCYSNWYVAEYMPYKRMVDNKTPSLVCDQKNDQFSYKYSSVGNNKLNYSIGLITADEVAMAGGVYDKTNTKYYLYTGKSYWTMSAYNFINCGANVFTVSESGALDVSISSSSGIGVSCSSNANSENGVRPVISLKADLDFEGDGTKDNPYKIKE